MKRLIIAAPQSGSGKTTVCAGLLAAFKARGLAVTPFKVGPDYIDPTYHTLAAGQPCHNLDPWLLTPEQMVASFHQRSRQTDLAVIEGAMGLFDGLSGLDDSGSAAHVARLLKAPVLLVLDVYAMARSAAAIVRGFCDFDPEVAIAGVILNRVGGPAHAQMVQDAIEDTTGVPVVGDVVHDPAMQLPERHLGLIPTVEPGRWQEWVEKVSAAVSATVDLERVLAMAAAAPPLSAPMSTVPLFHPTTGKRPVIAVAHDAAFNFVYADNLDLLTAAGAEVILFSPLYDQQLPVGTQGLYLCGGFPELYAAELAANQAIRQQIRQAHVQGLPIYAECGGLMFLTEAIVDGAGQHYPMVGLLPGQAVMGQRLTLGYRELVAQQDNWLWCAGEAMRGHEFHHSTWQARPTALPYLYEFQPDAYRPTPQFEGVGLDNLLASYTHLHFLARPELAARFVLAASQATPLGAIHGITV